MAGRMGWASSMVGRTLEGQYRIDGILGEGAMGVVFRGVNLSMDKAVAIKMMRKETFDTPDAVERFKREARVWSQLNHPAITQVFDFGIQDGMLFLVMELVDGLDLSDVLKQEGALKPLRAITLMRQLAAALEEAHRLGVVHRDIKPHRVGADADCAALVPQALHTDGIQRQNPAGRYCGRQDSAAPSR